MNWLEAGIDENALLARLMEPEPPSAGPSGPPAPPVPEPLQQRSKFDHRAAGQGGRLTTVSALNIEGSSRQQALTPQQERVLAKVASSLTPQRQEALAKAHDEALQRPPAPAAMELLEAPPGLDGEAAPEWTTAEPPQPAPQPRVAEPSAVTRCRPGARVHFGEGEVFYV